MRRDAFLAKTSRVSLELGFSGFKGKDTVSISHTRSDSFQKEANLTDNGDIGNSSENRTQS
jgi:hypothetical protein